MTGEQEERSMDFDVLESAPSGCGGGDPPTDGVDDSGRHRHVPHHGTPSPPPPLRPPRHGMRGQRRASLVDIMGESRRRMSLQVQDLHQGADGVQQQSTNEEDKNNNEHLGKSLTFQDYLDAQRKLRRSVRQLDFSGEMDIHKFYESVDMNKLMSYDEDEYEYDDEAKREDYSGEQPKRQQKQQTESTSNNCTKVEETPQRDSNDVDNQIGVGGGNDEHHRNDDSLGHHPHHHHSTSSSVPFYAPPLQRQRWGDDHVLPHVDWGDIFFDLFYVAAAYNLGGLLISFL